MFSRKKLFLLRHGSLGYGWECESLYANALALVFQVLGSIERMSMRIVCSVCDDLWTFVSHVRWIKCLISYGKAISFLEMPVFWSARVPLYRDKFDKYWQIIDGILESNDPFDNGLLVLSQLQDDGSRIMIFSIKEYLAALMKKVLVQLGKAWVDGLGSWLLTYRGALAPIASFPIPFDIYRCNGMSFGSKMLHNVEKAMTEIVKDSCTSWSSVTSTT